MRNLAILGLALLLAAPAMGQAPPFFGGGATAFDPEVSTLYSGALMDAQPVVSYDRKYVTLNMRVTNTRVRALVNFPVVNTEALGFVGGGNLGGANGGGAGGAPPVATPNTTPRGGAAVAPAGARPNAATPNAAPAAPSPDQISRNAKAWVFTRQGVYLVKPLE